MLGRVDKVDAMIRAGKKLGAGGHGLQDAGFTFLAEIACFTDCECNPLDQ